MKVSIVGTGYVGLVSGACFAELGHSVTCIDIDAAKVAKMKEGICPIYEPGLTEIMQKGIRENRLQFDIQYTSIPDAKVAFIAVGTPSAADGRADLKYVYAALDQIIASMKDGLIIVLKSTVPIGTAQKVKEYVSSKTKKAFHIVNNPEFLKEGAAVNDFMRPDRIVIGFQQEAAFETLEELYLPLVRQGHPILKMSNVSAEMTKYAANSFLATKISFINEVAKLCDSVGADIEEVRKGIMSDVRIGTHFLYPGPGYGGSCFPKDVKALLHTAEDYGLEMQVIQAAEDVNEEQRKYVFSKLEKHFGNLKGKQIALWGVAFKANTDDIRESAAIAVTDMLLEAGATVRFYDPEASAHFADLYKGKTGVKAVSEMYAATESADALVVLTEWRVFQNPDLEVLKSKLKTPVLVDARNLYSTKQVMKAGFHYYAIGKHIAKN